MSGRNRSWGMVGVLAVILVALIAVVLSRREPPTTALLDPANPGATGARAVAQVLSDHGVDVEIARSADELSDAHPDSDTTVLVTSIEQLGPSTARRLRDDADLAALVLVEPGPGVTAELHLPDGAPAEQSDPVSADCSDTRLGDLAIEVTQGFEYPTAQGCFPGERGFLVGFSSGEVTVLGAGDLLRNDRVLRSDNAAAALRLLGQRPRLVWYVPRYADLSAGDGVGLRGLVPRWIGPGLFLGLLVLAGTMIWRGRRLGPLATEPLPVSVKAIEAIESRGRLYRKAGDRKHAARVLRDGARRGLARRLSLPASAAADLEQLVPAVAAASGRSPDAVRALLDPPSAPGSDRELIAVARDLAELDREVRRT